MGNKAKNKFKINDIGKPAEIMSELSGDDMLEIPFEVKGDGRPAISPLTEKQKAQYEYSLDGVSAIALPKPKSADEEKKLVESFLNGLRKLLTEDNNWTFLQPLMLSLENCTKCLNCSESCPIYMSSGKKEIYRPNYRAEVLRRIIRKYIKKENNLIAGFSGDDIDLNWETIARLAELAYRCTLCRRCAQVCPIGVDNALITHELRKLFSQEMGIAPKELHESGTVQHLKTGSTTGMTPKAFQNIISFIEEDTSEKTGKKISIPVDKENADILLMHNAGEYMSWPEHIGAYAFIFETAGLNWTLSSEMVAYDAVNYGVWYDDVQFSRIAVKHAEIARKLKVNRILIGECGHAHKASLVIADRLLTGDLNIPRESVIPLLEDLVCTGKLALNPAKNDFPVTLHDPCNMVRMGGIIMPQRKILQKICPQFREMEPHGVHNYCCGGGSGFAIMQSMNFPDWKMNVSGKMKLKQILDTFADVLDKDIPKYVCAPCSNCKGQIRDLFDHYDITNKYKIYYSGLAEFIANAMLDNDKTFLSRES
jgi:Fe-S oxidoreductase